MAEADHDLINPDDPLHWGLEKILRDELALLRSKFGNAPEGEEDDHSSYLSSKFDEMLFVIRSVAFEKFVSPSDKYFREPWDPKVVSDETKEELHKANFLALCLSGGGIRSASFCLGVLQAFAKQNRLSYQECSSKNRLSCFDYISTVSGGGYIGSWLSAWCTRTTGIGAVESALSAAKEHEEVTNLRAFTSYLTPQRGLISSDTWAAIATVSRNLILNWLLFLPLFLSLVCLPKASVAAFQVVREWLNAASPEALSLDAWGVPSYLLAIAVFFYFCSCLFSSEQITLQLKRGGASGNPRPFGAGQGVFVLLGLAPAYVAACLASLVLLRMPVDPVRWQALLFFGFGGSLLWGIPFIVTWRRIDRLLAARFVAGFGFGVVLALAFTLLRMADGFEDDRYVVVFGIACCFLPQLAGGILFAGLSSRSLVKDDEPVAAQSADDVSEDAVREWSARAGGGFLLVGLGWTIYAILVLWDQCDWPGAFLRSHLGGWLHGLGDWLLAGIGGGAGWAAALLGESKSTPANNGRKTGARSNVDWSKVATVGGLIFFGVLIFELSRLFDLVVLPCSLADLAKHHDLPAYGFRLCLAVPLVLVIWIVAASWFINVNKFSLHAFYRNRLIRAYLGASNKNRFPSAFTGFDKEDNLVMGNLRKPKHAPFHVVNTALNLVHGKNLAWQQRKASSFTISPTAVGNSHLGYRPTPLYGDGVTLGTAMAISGAALSPNMGYHSSPVLALLMTLFNVRLGWWLGNPAKSAWRRAGPLQSVWPLLIELLGLTDANRDFVYLSDGGHFENLGLYELLQRRCRTIVAVDAGCDPDFAFADLGNALRKARIDFGIEITFGPQHPPGPEWKTKRLGLINRPKSPLPSPYCAIGTIHYTDGKPGTLIYIKAAIHGTEPEDIGSYAAESPAFPHESTADQFFTESQFESYRRLGAHIGESVFGKKHDEGCDAEEFASAATAAMASIFARMRNHAGSATFRTEGGK